MSTLNEGNTIGDVLKWEENMRFSREVRTLAANTTYAIGTVCKGTATMTPLGSGDAASATGVCLTAINTDSTGTQRGVFAVRNCQVDTNFLAYGGANQGTTNATLKALNIVPFTSI